MVYNLLYSLNVDIALASFREKKTPRFSFTQVQEHLEMPSSSSLASLPLVHVPYSISVEMSPLCSKLDPMLTVTIMVINTLKECLVLTQTPP